jgi:hypothetical protein
MIFMFSGDISDAREIMTNFKDQLYDRVKIDLGTRGIIAVRVTRRAPSLPCWGKKFCRDHPEVLQCSGTGLGFCDFMFFDRARRKYVVVTTYGEERLRVHSISYATKRDMEGWSPQPARAP